MNLTKPTVIISPEGFTANAELTLLAEAKAAKLRRHEVARIGHVRIHVKLETPRVGAARFVVVATAETSGADLVAHSTAAKPGTAVNAAFAKLERAVSAAAGVRKHRRQKLAPVVMFPEAAIG